MLHFSPDELWKIKTYNGSQIIKWGKKGTTIPRVKTYAKVNSFNPVCHIKHIEAVATRL